jgi:hypothetical protein
MGAEDPAVVCESGHALGADDKFCRECGAPPVATPRPATPNMLPSNETSQGYDRAWYCKHPPDPDGIDRSGSAYCSGMA